MRPMLFATLAALAALPAAAAEVTVHPAAIEDLKAVFGTVESLRETSARARIGGTVSELVVTEGQRVQAGERVAQVTDTKIALQAAGVDARIQSAEAQLQLAQTEFSRATELFSKGAGAKSRVDVARTQLEVARRTVAALRSERNVLTERGGEGAVLAPVNGRVLAVKVTEGSVVMPGEAIATIAVETYVLRILLPERHARSIRVGDTVWVGPRAMGRTGALARQGRVVKVYPRIENGRVTADVAVDGLGDYFVGERVPVHVATGERRAFLVPRAAVRRRFGLDTVTLKDGTEVVVQLGQRTGDEVEVLAGLKDGDTVVWGAAR